MATLQDPVVNGGGGGRSGDNGGDRDCSVLRTVYRALDTLQDDRVKRQDLLSIATKIHDRELLDKIRNRPWLQDLLQPERWGKHILRTSFSRTGSITCDAFVKFWQDYKQNSRAHDDEASRYDGADPASESDVNEAGTFARRDTYGSIGSFGSAGTDFYHKQQLKQQLRDPVQEREEVEGEAAAAGRRRPPQGPRKVLRALSVTSRGSGEVGPPVVRADSDASLPLSNQVEHHRKSHVPIKAQTGAAAVPAITGVRITVRANLEGSWRGSGDGAGTGSSASPPQVMVVGGTFEEFRQSVADRLGIVWHGDYILIHSLLRAQVLRINDLRDGDQLEVVRRDAFQSSTSGFEPRPMLASNSTLRNDSSDGPSGGTAWSPSRKHAEMSTDTGEEGFYSARSSQERVRVKEVSPFATFVRRPSWKDHYDSQPLPSAVRHSIRNILKRVSTSSSRWQRVGPAGCCPEESLLRDRLADFAACEKARKLSVEKVLGGIDKLDLQYGLGKNHARLLFVAVDQENTGTISMRHFQDMVMLWREVWAEHQTMLRMRAAEAEAEDRARRESAADAGMGHDDLGSSSDGDEAANPRTGSATAAAGSENTTSSSSGSRSRRPKTADSRPGSSSSSPAVAAAAPGGSGGPDVGKQKQKRPFYSKISQSTTHNKHMSQEASDKQKRILQARAAANKHSLLGVRPMSAMPATETAAGPGARAHQRPPRTPSAAPRRRPLGSEDASRRPSTAPSVPSGHRGPQGFAGPSYATEEEYLRAMHESKGEDPALLVGFASLLLGQVQRRSGCLHVPQGSEKAKGAHHPVFSEDDRFANPLDAAHRRKMDKARHLLSRALNASKLSEDKNTEAWAETRAEILCKLGEVSELEGDAAQARTLFHKAVRENPRSSPILCKYGTFLQKIGDSAGAKEYLLEALVHDRNCVDALLGYAILMSRSADPCDHKLAGQYFERARKNARQNRAPKDVRAKVLSQVAIYENTVLGNHEDAARDFERATQLDESFVDAWYELGRLRFAALEDTDGAVEAFEAALRHAPSHLPCLVGLAQILANSAARRDVQRAETLFAQALELEPGNTRVLLSHAEFLARVSKSEIRAEAMYERALASAPPELRGLCQMRMGAFFERRDVAKAVACYEEALRAPLAAGARLVDCLVAVGRCRAESGDLEQAREALTKAMAAGPASVEAKWLLATVEQRSGRRGAAGKLYRAAFEEAPEDGNVLTHFANFLLEYRGPTDDRQLAVAESMLRKALAAAADQHARADADFEPLALTLLGKLLARDPARRQQGVELLERGQRARPRAYEACYALALVLSEQVTMSRAAIYRGREQREAQSTLWRCIELFVTASEARENSVDAPLRACGLLLCVAETFDDPLERQASLERALKYGERAVRRAAKQQRKVASKPLTTRQAEASFLCGLALERQRRFGEATTNFMDAVALNPLHVLAMYHLSRRKEQDHDDLEGAQRVCLDALRATPTSHVGKVDQMELCRRVLHDYELAEARFMIVDGEREDPVAARALVMHQQLAQKAQEIVDAHL